MRTSGASGSAACAKRGAAVRRIVRQVVRPNVGDDQRNERVAVAAKGLGIGKGVRFGLGGEGLGIVDDGIEPLRERVRFGLMRRVAVFRDVIGRLHDVPKRRVVVRERVVVQHRRDVRPQVPPIRCTRDRSAERASTHGPRRARWTRNTVRLRTASPYWRPGRRPFSSWRRVPPDPFRSRPERASIRRRPLRMRPRPAPRPNRFGTKPIPKERLNHRVPRAGCWRGARS